MSGYQGPVVHLRHCAHGRSQFERCRECEIAREAEHDAERARVEEPAWVIEQHIKKHRRWFDGCAFCPQEPALVQWTVHRHDCPFVTAMAEARIAYGLHLVAVANPWTTQALRLYRRGDHAKGEEHEVVGAGALPR